MLDLNDIPDALMDLYEEECREALLEVQRLIKTGEAPKGVVRVFKKDGTDQYVCWGFESEEEKQAMIAMIDRHVSGGSTH